MATLLDPPEGQLHSRDSSIGLDYGTTTWLENDILKGIYPLVPQNVRSFSVGTLEKSSNEYWRSLGAHEWAFDFSTATSIGRSARSSLRTSGMVARQFDGPEPPASNLDSLRKRNSDARNMMSGLSRDIGFDNEASKLNFRAMGYDYQASSSHFPSKSPAHVSLLQSLKSSARSQRLTSTPRPLTPRTRKLSIDHTTLNQAHSKALLSQSPYLHIPGSFIPESGSLRASKSLRISLEAASSSSAEPSAAEKAHSPRGSIDQSSTLSRRSSHPSENGSPGRQFVYKPDQLQAPVSKLTGSNLLTSLYSQSSPGTSRHLLLKPSADPLLSEFPALPVMSCPSKADLQQSRTLDHKRTLPLEDLQDKDFDDSTYVPLNSPMNLVTSRKIRANLSLPKSEDNNIPVRLSDSLGFSQEVEHFEEDSVPREILTEDQDLNAAKEKFIVDTRIRNAQKIEERSNNVSLLYPRVSVLPIRTVLSFH